MCHSIYPGKRGKSGKNFNLPNKTYKLNNWNCYMN